jgi:hypothetical protein
MGKYRYNMDDTQNISSTHTIESSSEYAIFKAKDVPTHSSICH